MEEYPPSLHERLSHRIILCGSPPTVVEQIKYLRDHLGVGVISRHFQVGNIDDALVRTGMRLFRDQVLTHFK